MNLHTSIMREDGLKVMYNRKYFLKMHFFGCDVFRLGQKKPHRMRFFLKSELTHFCQEAT